MVMFVGCKPYNATIVVPTGWTLVTGTDGANGTVAMGVDTGSVLWKAMTREWVSGDAAPTVSITTGNTALGVIHAFSRAALASWQIAGAKGNDITGGTDFIILMDANPGITNGDMLVHGAVIAGNNATLGTPTMTATGATIGTVTESPATEGTTALGNDLEASASYAACTAGTAIVAPTCGWTTSVAQTGGGSIVRLREGPYVPPASKASRPAVQRVLDHSHPLAQGLTALWPLDEGFGDAVRDVTGRAPRALLTATKPTWSATAVGPALRFAGVNGGVQVQTTLLASMDWRVPITCAALVKVSSTLGGLELIYDHRQSSSGWALGRDGQNITWTKLAVATMTATVASLTNTTDWVFVAASQVSGTLIRFYGYNLTSGVVTTSDVADASAAVTGAANLNWIGTLDGTSNNFRGDIAFVAVWVGRALSNPELREFLALMRRERE